MTETNITSTIKSIAGHSFFKAGDRCSCGKRWTDLVLLRAKWSYGEHGVAHTGGLTETEVKELFDYEEHIYASIRAAAESQ